MNLQILKATLLSAGCVCISATAAVSVTFDIPSGDLRSALNSYSAQTGVELIFPAEAISGRQTKGAKGELSLNAALVRILSGTSLAVHQHGTAVAIVEDGSESSLPPAPLVEPIHLAAAAPERPVIETVTVTSSKLGNADVQSIPIAITALSEEQLQAQKIEGGPDLVKGVPNLTFSKTNFTGYNIQIRGIGTQAISTTTDPGVAVAFNDIPFIRNHFFEQEFFDVADVEVLRGPQGTLYGRNATAGVVNISSAKPTDEFEGQLKGELGTYSTKRARGFINIPIVGDMLDVRLAGSYLKRNGYTFDDLTDSHVDGRNLWSARASVRYRPTSWADINLVAEHFAEDDDRLRSGKQLCKRDDGPTSIFGVDLTAPVTTAQTGGFPLPESVYSRGLLSQGCSPTSLYSPSAFQTPNTNAIPYFLILENGYPSITLVALPTVAPGKQAYALNQSTNLRTISSTIEPHYKATNNTIELNADFNVTPNLTLTSQTGFSDDSLYSTEDYNRFATSPDLFLDTRNGTYTAQPLYPGLAPGDGPATGIPQSGQGIYCDPQLGCSDRLVGEDLSQEHSQQISQELRLASNFSGKFNFSAGGNYTHYRTIEDYYVFINGLSMLSEILNNNINAGFIPGDPGYNPGLNFPSNDRFNGCSIGSFNPSQNFGGTIAPACIYLDPNPVGSINGQGHNYYRSQNPYTLNSYAGFGETYYQVTPDLKLIAGMRWTDDNKTFTPIPTQLLLSTDFYTGGGLLNKGFYALPNIDQHWGKFTGRFVANWTPKVEFTDQSMFYASYSRGYKAGGANPPSVGFYEGGGTVSPFVAAQIPAMPTILINGADPFHPIITPGPTIPAGTTPDDLPGLRQLFPAATGFPCITFVAPVCVTGGIGNLQTAGFPATFRPEFVDAYELGTKNTALDGALTVNGDVFFYNYYDYQISKIQDRTAINENFDAKVWGTEVEATWEPVSGLRVNFGGGYEASRVGGHQSSLDLMDRTDSNSNYIILKPFVTTPSNCVVQKQWVQDNLPELYLAGQGVSGNFDTLSKALAVVCSGRAGGGNGGADPSFSIPYGDPTVFPNGGQGILKDVSGNELPNTPHFTVSLGAQYTMPVNGTWTMLARTDFYYQSNSWARVYNDSPYDRLHGYTNVNFTVDLVKDSGLMVELYVKNALNTTAITGDFLNSDDSGLTTNVFTTDPRLVGISITQSF